jgi:integral membrane sensor domain MASE1
MWQQMESLKDIIIIIIIGAPVACLVEALCYKPEGRGFR